MLLINRIQIYSKMVGKRHKVSLLLIASNGRVICLMQALGMLFWHKHNFEKALADLPNFTPFPDEWTVEDKVLFEQAFNFHGKTFHRIRQMVHLLCALVVMLISNFLLIRIRFVQTIYHLPDIV